MLAQASESSFDDLAARATAARGLGDASGAVPLYRQAVELNPRWPDGWWYLGALQYGAGAYADARDALTRYLELTPDAAPALAIRGLCEFETAEYAQSLADIQRGLAGGAGNAPRNEKILRYHEGLLLAHSARFEEALSIYGSFSHEADSRDQATDAELPLAVGLAGLRVPILPKDVAAERKEMFILAGTAALRYLAGDKEGGTKGFQEFFQRFPTAPNAHYLHGYLLFSAEPDKAVPELKRELEVSPSNAAAEVLLAWVALMENDPASALPFAAKAARDEPAASGVDLVLGRSLVETGDIKNGLAHLENALRTDPDNLELHLALVKAYANSGRKADARRERQLCLQLSNRFPNPGNANP